MSGSSEQTTDRTLSDERSGVKTYIALFRGINVGGHNVLPMQDLVSILQGLGLRDVRTYIQSGNAVFRSPGSDAAALSDRIGAAVEASHGFRPEVMVLSLEELRAAEEACPYPVDPDSKLVHLCFLAGPALDPDLEKMDAMKTATEEYVLADRVLYLHAPDGIGRSKLAAKVERLLGVSTTGRNWRSVTKILEMAEKNEGGGG